SARREIGYAAILLQRIVGPLGQPRTRILSVLLDQRLCRLPAVPAEQSPRGRQGALDIDIHEGIAKRSHGDLDTQSATKFPQAAACLAQTVLLDDHRIIKLLKLDRRVLHPTLADRHGRAFAVLVSAPAPTPTHDGLAQKSSSRARIAAEKSVATHIPFVAGGDSLRHGGSQRSQDQ